MRGRPILPALDGLQGSLAVTGLTLHSTADFPPSCGKLFTTHSAVLGSFHWAGRTAFKMREPAPYRSHDGTLQRTVRSSKTTISPRPILVMSPVSSPRLSLIAIRIGPVGDFGGT